MYSYYVMCRVFVQVMSLTCYMCEPITLFNNDETTSLPHICVTTADSRKRKFDFLHFNVFFTCLDMCCQFPSLRKKNFHHNKREFSSFSVYVSCIYIDRLLKKILFYLFDSILVILRWKLYNQIE